MDHVVSATVSDNKVANVKPIWGGGGLYLWQRLDRDQDKTKSKYRQVSDKAKNRK